MFTILLSLLCSTLVFSAPTDTVPWTALKNDTLLTRFHSTLLNETLITFLDECYSPQLTMKARIPCSRYFDAIRQLNRTDFIVELPKVVKLLNEPSKDENFCKQNHTFPPMEYYPTKKNDFTDPMACGIWCLDDNFTLEPICAFLVWMGDEIKSHSTAKPAEVPSLPVNVPSLKGSDQTMLTNAGTSLDKTIPANTSNKTVQSTISNTIAQDTTIAAAAKPVDKDVQLANQKSASEVDLTENKSNDHELNKALAANTAAAMAASMGTAEKKQESTPTNAPPGTEIADEDQRIIDKQDSFDQQQPDDQPIENDSDMEDANQDEMDDDDDDHDIINQQKPPKGVKAIATSEPEQKNSLEIFDGNYLSKLRPNQKIDPFLEEPGSNFFTYFLFGMLLCIIMYVVYHNKSKILALLLEGRRSDKGRGGRRKHTAAYRKLDSNLEEAITSSASGRITQIIY